MSQLRAVSACREAPHGQTGRLKKYEYYDQMTERIIGRILKPDAACIDVGCHAGSILRMMLDRAPRGSFLAFEPLPDYYAGLCRDFSDNPHVRIYDCALSNTNGRTSFKWVKSNPGYSGLRERRGSSRGLSPDARRIVVSAVCVK